MRGLESEESTKENATGFTKLGRGLNTVWTTLALELQVRNAMRSSFLAAMLMFTDLMCAVPVFACEENEGRCEPSLWIGLYCATFLGLLVYSCLKHHTNQVSLRNLRAKEGKCLQKMPIHFYRGICRRVFWSALSASLLTLAFRGVVAQWIRLFE